MNNSNSDHTSIVAQNQYSLKINEMSKYKDEEGTNTNHDLKPVTKAIQKVMNEKRNYVHTTNEQRLELLEAVYDHGERVKSAANRLRINYSAAKAICQIYKSEGRSMKKLPKKRLPNPYKIKEELLLMSLNNNADPLKMLPIIVKKENVEEEKANASIISEKKRQLMKNLIQRFPEVSQAQQYQNLIPRFFINSGPPSIDQHSVSTHSVTSLPVICSQICTSKIVVVLPAQTQNPASQPIVSVNRLSVLTQPLYNPSQFNNFQVSSYLPSIPSYRFVL